MIRIISHVVPLALGVALVAASLSCRSWSPHSRGAPRAAQGIMVGEVSPTSAVIQVRLTASDGLLDGDVPGAPGVVEFRLLPEDAGAGVAAQAKWASTVPEHDFIARVRFVNLSPGTSWVCTTSIARSREHAGGERTPGPSARFRTLQGAATVRPARFVVVTGMNYAKFHGDSRIDRAQHVVENNTELPPSYEGEDRALGYPALDAIRELAPDFFVGTGDNVYYDTPDDPRAETVPELRQKWHEQFVQRRYVDLFAVVPTYWEIDDHDYRIDDGDNTGEYHPTPELGRRMMLEQLPIGEMGDETVKTYRTHRVNRDLQVWFPENRMYRSPNATPDGPGKTIWGDEQREWLKRTLLESDATFKLLVSPTPMIGPDDLRKTDNHTNIGGFRHERDEFFAWVKASGLLERGFLLVCGDRHWQYHSIHPSGIEEFSCGALVDANSRPARRPGDPKSTDPQGLIRQPYAQDPPTGGFLEVEVSREGGDGMAALTFRHRDEHGVVLNEHRESRVAE